MVTELLAPAHSSAALAGHVRRRPERPRAPGFSIERLHALDAELARRASDAGRLRFEMGRGLDLLAQSGGHHALGFSSLEAYALERCERSASWTHQARRLARRLNELPPLADALISGSITWSMAAVLALVASPDDAEFWLAEASNRTVREVALLVSERQAASKREHALEAEEDLRTLTLTVPREDAWCFEQAKLLGRHLGERTHADLVFGLVAESTSTLCSELPSRAIEVPDDDATSSQRAWEHELARMRAEADVRCELNFCRRHENNQNPPIVRLEWPNQPEAIDQQLRELASELVSREVAYGRALEAFFSADGWRRLGYASGRQYAHERLGTSLSSVKDKRWLVKRLGQLRFLADSLDRGQLGYEAARLVASVATGETVAAWVERARERTLRHLRQDIGAAELVARWSENATVLPPSDADVRRVEDLERGVLTGQISAPPAPAATPLASVTLHLRVHATTARDFRHWEAIYLRHRGSALRHTTFLRFACELFLDTWRPRPSDVEYSHIYERDRHTCQSPCCGRRDVTPHHIRFRAHGGDDSDENVTSLCTWCHLEGIHGGQISAAPPASNIRWTFGRNQHTVVEGRRRLRRSRDALNATE